MTALPTLDRRGDYVSAVAVELADLAADDRVELIEELDDHIAALLDDRPETDLIAELGTPAAYAAELRTAAGLTGVVAGAPPLHMRIRALVSHVDAAMPDRVRPYLAGVRPGWWVLRGYLLVAAGVQWTGLSRDGGTDVLVPRVWGNWGIGLLLTVAAVLASVRLGAVPRVGRGRMAAVVALDVVALAGALVLYAEASDPYPGSDGGVTCSGATNLYPYDANGQPLTDVRIVDQFGTPFELSGVNCQTWDPSFDLSRPDVYPYPTAPVATGFDVQTGPPTSLAPLPGATVPSTAGGASASPPASSAVPTPTGVTTS